MSSQPSITSFFAPEIPIKSVTVFTKGAEIHRTLKVSLKVGFNEIQILNVVETIKPNSIRVEGHGPATIHGVKLSNEYVYDETCNPQKLKDLKLLIKDLENQIENEKYYAKIYDTQIDVLNNAVKAIGNNQSKEGINPETMEKLFEYHENKYVETKIKAKKIQEKINSFDAEKCKIKVELNKYDSKCIRMISIELENQKNVNNVEIELDISYHVSNASWSPYYDIRVKSENDIHEMQLSYFGNIVQESDEDWNDVDLFLSTAQPCLEGNLPKSEATFIRFHRSPPPKYAKPYSRESIREGTKCRAKRARFRPSECFRDSQTSPAYGATSPVPQKLQQMTTIAEENILSTTFTIPNKKSIPTNSTKHKVTITVETFQAYLHYHCVPKKDINVYLMATVINNSDYPILAGPATIYVNNSLSATIKLNSISCGEKMECPLGVDKQVKVVYKPSKIFQSQNGIINKSSISTSEQRIIVKNNKRDEPIHLTIHEGIPQSSDERIQIQLLSPDMLSKNNSVIKPYFAAEGCQRIQLPSVGIEMDDLNNLLWTEMIKAEEEKEFKIKWSIDFPNDKTLEYFKYDQEEHQKSFSISDSE